MLVCWSTTYVLCQNVVFLKCFGIDVTAAEFLFYVNIRMICNTRVCRRSIVMLMKYRLAIESWRPNLISILNWIESAQTTEPFPCARTWIGSSANLFFGTSSKTEKLLRATLPLGDICQLINRKRSINFQTKHNIGSVSRGNVFTKELVTISPMLQRWTGSCLN